MLGRRALDTVLSVTLLAGLAAAPTVAQDTSGKRLSLRERDAVGEQLGQDMVFVQVGDRFGRCPQSGTGCTGS